MLRQHPRTLWMCWSGSYSVRVALTAPVPCAASLRPAARGRCLAVLLNFIGVLDGGARDCAAPTEKAPVVPGPFILLRAGQRVQCGGGTHSYGSRGMFISEAAGAQTRQGGDEQMFGAKRQAARNGAVSLRLSRARAMVAAARSRTALCRASGCRCPTCAAQLTVSGPTRSAA